MTVTPPFFLERQSCTRATDTAPMLGDPGADSRGGTKILRGKSERVKVYKTSDKTSGLLLGQVPEWLAVLAFDWPEKYCSGQSAKSIFSATFVPSCSGFVIAINRRACVVR